MLKLNSAAGKSVSCVLLLAAAAVGWKLAWNHWRDDVTLHPAYSISGDHIHISPAPPDFIPGDIKAEVVRLGSLEDLPLLDPGITAKIAGAFELHPWVARTLRVTKRSGGVDVELEYRVPVALVQVTYNGERGTLPVDKQAVVLPIDAFRNQQGELAQFARGLPRIDGGESIPLNPDGAKWGDENIAGAAGIAAILKEQWQTLGLYRIAVWPTTGKTIRRRRTSSLPETAPAFCGAALQDAKTRTNPKPPRNCNAYSSSPPETAPSTSKAPQPRSTCEHRTKPRSPNAARRVCELFEMIRTRAF